MATGSAHFIAFIDLAKAFHMEDYFRLATLLLERSCLSLVFRIICNLIAHDVRSRVLVNGPASVGIRGVLQGSSISLILSNIYPNDLVCRLNALSKLVPRSLKTVPISKLVFVWTSNAYSAFWPLGK